jgi:4-amino-4-deoxy-L-arabinose transferase-like glycosyltransferase
MNTRKNVATWILVGIIIFAFLFRVIGLSSHPAGFTPDEASFGYDAYSILHTGKDQWGKALPLVFESFGDGKMPLLTYLAIPSVALFGLNEFAVRLPNAIFGSLAVLAVYALTFEAVKRKRAALIAAFLLAVSPWGIAMSRGAFEANLTVFLLPLAIYFYLKGKQNSKYLILAVILAAINMFSYHSARLVTPILFGILVLMDWKSFKKDKWFNGAVGIAVISISLVATTYLLGAGTRITSSSILSLSGSDQRYQTTLVGSPDIFGKIFYNRATYLGSTLIRNYLSYYSPQFLFVNGAGETTYGMVPGKALFHLGEAIFLVGFLYFLFKNGLKKLDWLIVWILIAAIPAALTIGPGYAANRAVILLPALVIAGGIGALVFRNIKIIYGVLVLIAVSFIFFLHSYWYLQPAVGANGMIYGAREVVEYVKEHKNEYDKVFVTKKLSEPHIYFAFYNKIDPAIYQNESKNWKYKDLGLTWVDQIPHYNLEGIDFKNFDWKVESQKEENILFVGTPDDFPQDQETLLKIVSPTKKDIYWIVDNKNK